MATLKGAGKLGRQAHGDSVCDTVLGGAGVRADRWQGVPHSKPDPGGGTRAPG